jgi:monoamine oxidase
MDYDIIIVGAGVAGLMATKELSAAGYKICVLEADTKPGGRIATVHGEFDAPVESGAEFIHSNAPLTLQLLQDAGISYEAFAGEMVTVKKGKWMDEGQPEDHWKLFIQRAAELKTDMPLYDFLEKYFAAPGYCDFRKSIQIFAEGFVLADITRGSVMQVKEEWSHQSETQYRVRGGYGKLIDHFTGRCITLGAEIIYNAVVSKINYHSDKVNVYTDDNRQFNARYVVVTVSLGVLQAGIVEFIPALTTHATALRQLGFGAVIKILLQFKDPFWKNYAADAGFFISHEIIPTWWTQDLLQNNLLTGWLGGPAAEKKSSESNESLLQTSLQSLAAIFHLDDAGIRQQLDHYKIVCWHNQRHIKGGYSYNTTDSPEAKRILSLPVNGRVFFAGEAVFAGESQGTVEAALQSGKAVAAMMRQY